MNKREIISALESIRGELQAEGVTHLAVFGSQARGDARPNSDLDILIDVEPKHPFSILDLVGVEHLVQDATGIVANAFVRRSLDDSFLKSISPESIPVF